MSPRLSASRRLQAGGSSAGLAPSAQPVGRSYPILIFGYTIALLTQVQYESANSEKPVGVLDNYTTWQHPYRNTQILVHPSIVRSLSARALQAAKEESEIGGVLWGRVGGGDDSITIVDATLVPNSGQLFNTTARDSRDIAQALSGRGPRANLSVAGYFRSYIREGLSLTPQDQTLIQQQLRDPDAVFMVIKPFAIGVCTAGLFFWQDGRLQTDASDLEVPFIAFDDSKVPKERVPLYETERPNPAKPLRTAFEEAASTTDVPGHSEEPSIVTMLRESAMRNSPQPPSQQARQLPAIAPPAAPEPERRMPVRLLVAAGIMCLLGVVFATGLSIFWPVLRARFQGPPEHPPQAHINLQVTRDTNGQLDLNWDRTAPDVMRASSGTLSIMDGRGSHTLKLDNDQLRAGKLLYFAKNDDVRFRLELNTDSMHTVSESVRVLLPETEGRRPRQQAAASEHALHAVQSASPAEVADRRGTGSPRPDPFETPRQQQRPLETEVHATPSRPPLSLVPSMVTATSGAPAAQNTPAGTFIPPQVVEEMMPETAPLGQFAQISVEVNIDQTGRVTAAHPVEDATPGNAGLTEIATAAAMRWRFSPATLNGKPVEAQYRIVFAFHRHLK